MNIVIVGFGRTGQQVKQIVDEREDLHCLGVISSRATRSLDEIEGDVDVIIDFSHPDNLSAIDAYAVAHGVPLVLATTGYEAEHIEKIHELSTKVPVAFTANFSLGVTVFKKLIGQLPSALLDTFDIELIERHHRYKLDAPSGTAKMLLTALDKEEKRERQYGREGMGKRGNEIGVHSIRGGSIPGEHTLILAGPDEVLEIKHQALSNRVFANGALLAAEFVVKQQPGLYDMEDVLFG